MSTKPSHFASLSCDRTSNAQQKNRNNKKIVIDTLRSQNILVSPTIFNEPTKREALPILKEFVKIVVGYQININSQQQLKAFIKERLLNLRSQSLSYEFLELNEVNLNNFLPDQGERHLAAVDLVALYRCLQQLGFICGLERITLEDVLQPRGDRLLLYASAVVDFIRFQETHMLDVYVKWNKIREDRLILSDIKVHTKLIREDLNNSALETEKQRSELQNFVLKENQASEALKVLAIELRNCHEKVKEVESQSNDAEEQLKTAEDQISFLEIELSQLSSQIVESPQRITKALKDKTDQLNTINRNFEEVSSRLPVLQVQVEVLQHFFRQLESVVTSLNEYETVHKKLCKVLEIVTKTEKKAEVSTVEASRLCKEVETAKKAFSDLSDQLNSEHVETDNLRASLEKLKQEHQSEREYQIEQRRVRKRDIEDMRQEIIRLNNDLQNMVHEEEKIEKLNASNEEDLITMLQRFEEDICSKFGKHATKARNDIITAKKILSGGLHISNKPATNEIFLQ